ncbi:MAG: pyruvate carboxylase subunit B [Spirochaetes bacterium GWB1_36_13]|nr:MAG: pyruvate carboxylase subunit B [Spirochaetes bacterium GWB1_36_13]
MAAKTRLVGITDTSLRDAPQSLWATRIKTDEILSIAEKIDDAGYHSVEVWGGATFDVMLRFLDEDPWQRLRRMKKIFKKSPLQMLLRGQNIVGYKNYPDDVLEAFVNKAAELGIDIFRVFDALNDIRNLEASFKFIKKTGKHLQGTICYTKSPVHTVDYFVNNAKKQQNLGIDSLCIKDMSGILSPIVAYELVHALKKEISVPIQLHCHASSGMATAAYVKAIEAGVDVIDCAVGPLALFSSQPPVESMVAIIEEMRGLENKVDLHLVKEISEYFEKISYKKKQFTKMQNIIDISVIIHQIPGGMVSNLLSQLEQQRALDKLDEVLNEVPSVRKDLGYPPLVTPTSQIVGTQAVFNVITGERYKIIPEEVKNYAAGFYGLPPAEMNPKIRALILGDRKPIENRPADSLEPMMPKIKKELDKKFVQGEEDYISYALFPQVALAYFKWRENPSQNQAPSDIYDPLKKEKEAEVTMEDALSKKTKTDIKSPIAAELLEIAQVIDQTSVTSLEVEFDNKKIKLSCNVNMPFEKSAFTPSSAPAKLEEKKTGDSVESSEKVEGEKIVSPMVGTYYSSPSPDAPPFAKEGDVIEAGSPLCIVEAMKMFNQISAEKKVKILKVLHKNGDMVEFDTPLFIVQYL